MMLPRKVSPAAGRVPQRALPGTCRKNRRLPSRRSSRLRSAPEQEQDHGHGEGGADRLDADDAGHQPAVAAELAGEHTGGRRRRCGVVEDDGEPELAAHAREPADRPGEERHGEKSQDDGDGERRLAAAHRRQGDGGSDHQQRERQHRAGKHLAGAQQRPWERQARDRDQQPGGDREQEGVAEHREQVCGPGAGRTRVGAHRGPDGEQVGDRHVQHHREGGAERAAFAEHRFGERQRHQRVVADGPLQHGRKRPVVEPAGCGPGADRGEPRGDGENGQHDPGRERRH